MKFAFKKITFTKFHQVCNKNMSNVKSSEPLSTSLKLQALFDSKNYTRGVSVQSVISI
jgi:hypothetical protein